MADQLLIWDDLKLKSRFSFWNDRFFAWFVDGHNKRRRWNVSIGNCICEASCLFWRKRLFATSRGEFLFSYFVCEAPAALGFLPEEEWLALAKFSTVKYNFIGELCNSAAFTKWWPFLFSLPFFSWMINFEQIMLWTTPWRRNALHFEILDVMIHVYIYTFLPLVHQSCFFSFALR